MKLYTRFILSSSVYSLNCIDKLYNSLYFLASFEIPFILIVIK